MLQAAIAVEHVNARTAQDTRWEHIAALYSHLAALAPDPVVELNCAVAIAMAGDLADGLARIDALAAALDGYQYFHAARADLLRRLGEAAGGRGLRARARADGRRRRARVPGAAVAVRALTLVLAVPCIIPHRGYSSERGRYP